MTPARLAADLARARQAGEERLEAIDEACRGQRRIPTKHEVIAVL